MYVLQEYKSGSKGSSERFSNLLGRVCYAFVGHFLQPSTVTNTFHDANSSTWATSRGCCFRHRY